MSGLYSIYNKFICANNQIEINRSISRLKYMDTNFRLSRYVALSYLRWVLVLNLPSQFAE